MYVYNHNNPYYLYLNQANAVHTIFLPKPKVVEAHTAVVYTYLSTAHLQHSPFYSNFSDVFESQDEPSPEQDQSPWKIYFAHLNLHIFLFRNFVGSRGSSLIQDLISSMSNYSRRNFFPLGSLHAIFRTNNVFFTDNNRTHEKSVDMINEAMNEAINEAINMMIKSNYNKNWTRKCFKEKNRC